MRSKSFAAVVSLAPVVVLTSTVASAQSRSLVDEMADRQALARVIQLPFVDVCDRDGLLPGHARCLSNAVTDEHGTVRAFDAPQGYGPSDLASAYKLPSTGGNGRLVAIVDANDSANAESDLAKYRSQFGLPPCTTANGCFKKVDQNGGTHYPPSDSCSNGWATEISLDLDMVSASCPDCHILLVEASSTNNSDLAAAVATALKLGAVAVSNSYGGSEDDTTLQLDDIYSSSTAWIMASSGDSGYGAMFPATGSHVLAVGGTTLQSSSSSRGWAESAWRNGGSGCSAYVTKPGWQADKACKNRMEADVSAVADPNTGVAVYCTDAGLGGFPGGGFPGFGGGGWMVMGGTSASAPLVAGAFTLLDLPPDPAMPWKSSGKGFFDVTSGSNGFCATNYYCNAGTGYDGPTGWGTPNGALLKTLAGGVGGGADGGITSSDGGDGGDGGGSSGSGAGDGGTTSPDGGDLTGGSGSSSGGGDTGSSGAGADGGSSGNNGDTNPNWQNNPPSSGGCTVVDGRPGPGYGGLAAALGLAVGWAARRRRAHRRAP